MAQRALLPDGLLVLLAISGFALWSGSASAQASAPVCMSSKTPDGRAFTVRATPEKVKELEGRGFVQARCSTELSRADNAERSRANICRFASRVPQEGKALFEKTYRISPDEMCAMSNALAFGFARAPAEAAK